MTELSESGWIIDHVDGRIGKETAYVFNRAIHDPLAAFFRSPGNMRRDQTIFCAEQRIIRQNRFCRYNVKAGGKNFPGIQRVSQILLDDQRASGVIEDDDAVFHFGNGVPVDNSLRGGEERAMQCDHVRCFQQRIQRYIVCDPDAKNAEPKMNAEDITESYAEDPVLTKQSDRRRDR